jgi:hypothetical protein
MHFPWVHHTVWQRTKSFFDRIFHHDELVERSRVHKIALIYILVVSLLTAVIYFAYSSDLRAFSYEYSAFALSSPPSLSSELSDQLTSIYHASDWVSFHSRLYTWSVSAFIILTALTSLYLSLHKMRWQISFILKRLGLFLLFQFAYILPLLVFIFVPEFVVDDLLKTADGDIHVAREEIVRADPSTKLITQVENIGVALSTLTVPPLLLADQPVQEGLISYFDIAQVDTFYRAMVLPDRIYRLNISDLGHSAILFPNHHLFISADIAKDELATLLTSLSLKMYDLSSLRENFAGKTAPKIEFLAQDEYNELENKKSLQQQKKIEDYIASLRKEVTDNNRYLTQAEADLNSLRNDKNAYENRVTPLLAECRVLYEAGECDSASAIVNQTIAEYNTAIQTVESNIVVAKANIPILTQAQASARATLDKFLSFPIIPELQSGIFEPPQTILIKHAEGLTPANQYYTLLHELAHYYSHSSKANLPSFLEEGITDYVALKVGQPTRRPLRSTVTE